MKKPLKRQGQKCVALQHKERDRNRAFESLQRVVPRSQLTAEQKAAALNLSADINH